MLRVSSFLLVLVKVLISQAFLQQKISSNSFYIVFIFFMYFLFDGSISVM